MRAVIQRVRTARVDVDGNCVGEIPAGLLVYLGVSKHDGTGEATWMAEKIAGLRIFPNDEDRMTRSARDLGAPILVVSQFTLYGDVRKGRRPSFERAAAAEHAQHLYESTCTHLREAGLAVETGQFQAQMTVHAQVDGPVTILVDSDKEF